MRMRWMAVCGLGLAVAAVGMGAAAGKAADKTAKYTFTLVDSKGGDAGKVTFTQKGAGPVKMHVQLQNLPFGEHAVHIHVNAVLACSVAFQCLQPIPWRLSKISQI